MSSNATVPAESSPAPQPSSPPPASSQPPAPQPSTPAPEPTPNPQPSSQAPNPPASSAAPPPTSQNNADTTQVTTASAPPPTTEVQTIITTLTPSRAGETPSVVIITSTITPTPGNTQQNNPTGAGGSARPSGTNGIDLQNAQSDNAGGLGTGGKTAIAVVIPVVVVALLVLGGIFFWRKRKQRKSNEDERRKEVEEYGYNPNHDPTLPAVGGLAMAEDDSGYRGWGNTATSSGRKASTTLTSGMTYSDSNSNPGGYAGNSPTHGTYSDGNSDNPLMNNRRETMDSDGIGALGVVNGAATNSAHNQTGVHRGPSNASSSYSAANRSDNSGDYPGMAHGNPQEYYDQGYYQSNPYASNDPYAAQQQPIIRDVSARRNTRIENPSVFPQQGNSGIAQNF